MRGTNQKNNLNSFIQQSMLQPITVDDVRSHIKVASVGNNTDDFSPTISL